MEEKWIEMKKKKNDGSVFWLLILFEKDMEKQKKEFSIQIKPNHNKTY